MTRAMAGSEKGTGSRAALGPACTSCSLVSLHLVKSLHLNVRASKGCAPSLRSGYQQSIWHSCILLWVSDRPTS